MTEMPSPEESASQAPSYPPPPGYPSSPPPYGYPPGVAYAYYGPRPTNGFAIASLVCAIAAFVTFGLTSPLAVIFGHVASSQIRRKGEQGAGLALAGLIIGYLALALLVLFICVLLFVPDLGDPSYDDGLGI